MSKVSSANQQKAFLFQKLRLAYLHTRFFPNLKTHDLCGRLKLVLRDGSKGFSEEYLNDRGFASLPRDLKISSVETEEAFKKRIITDPSKSGYVKNAGLDSDLCNALGFVFADEHIKSMPSSDTITSDGNLFEKLKQIGEDQKRDDLWKKISGFLSSCAAQPIDFFHGAESGQVLEIVPGINDIKVDGRTGENFLRGKEIPDLKFVYGGFTIARTIEEKLLEDILANSSQGFLVTSAAGDGKTTLLCRLASHLLDDGWRVLFKSAKNHLETIGWELGGNEADNTVVLIDRAETLKCLKDLKRWMAVNSNVTVVLATRDVDWKKRTDLDEVASFLKPVTIGRLGETEINALATLLFDQGVVEDATNADVVKDRLRESVGNTKFPHMLAAMMSACSGNNFENILETMVDDFEPESLLRWVTLGSTFPHKKATPFFLTEKLIWQLFSDFDENRSTGREKFEKIYDKVRSEIVHLNTNQYDLRHPDITEFALAKFYDFENGKLRKPDALEEDLKEILRAACNQLTDSQDITYAPIGKFAKDWWLSDLVSNHDLGRALFRSLIGRIGNFDRDRSFKAHLLDEWFKLEETEPESNAFREIRSDFLPEYFELAEDIYEARGSVGPLIDVYKRRLKFAIENDQLGNLHEPAKGSARGVFQTMWNSHNAALHIPMMVHFWTELETSSEGLGSRINPAPYTHRWLYYELLQEARERRDHIDVLTYWINLEKKHNNIGSGRVPEKFSARDICRRAWQPTNARCNLFNSVVMHRWADLEADAHNYGDEGDEFSVRWIFNQAWINRNNSNLFDSNVLVEWGTFEKQAFAVGQGEKTGYVDVFRMAWEDDKKWVNSNVVRCWADLEADAHNYGDESDEFSVRWIFNQAWTNRNNSNLFDSNVLAQWGLIENQAFEAGQGEKTGGLTVFNKAWEDNPIWFNAHAIVEWILLVYRNGNYDKDREKYSALWILETAWDRSNRSRLFSDHVASIWVDIEIQRNFFGEWKSGTPTYPSARWVALQTFQSDITREVQLAKIACFDGHEGSFDNPEQDTARFIWRKLYNKSIISSFWLQFEIAQEREVPRTGEFSARWIYDQWAEKENRPPSFEEVCKQSELFFQGL